MIAYFIGTVIGGLIIVITWGLLAPKSLLPKSLLELVERADSYREPPAVDRAEETAVPKVKWIIEWWAPPSFWSRYVGHSNFTSWEFRARRFDTKELANEAAVAAGLEPSGVVYRLRAVPK